MPHPLMGMVPLVVLLALIGGIIYLFDGDVNSGNVQLAMIIATMVSIGLALWRHYCTWGEFVESMGRTVADTLESMLIVLLIGLLSASWMVSGAVPTMICYGTQVISPKFFLVTSCLVCSGVSLMTGSSWSCVATIGIALLGIGNALGVPMGWTAGSIISGAYFGDKVSPLSETTILASSTTKTPLYTHIRNLMATTVPSLTIACIVFTVVGLNLNITKTIDHSDLVDSLNSIFYISPLTLIVPLLTIVLIVCKVPALATMALSSCLSLVMAFWLQPNFLDVLIGSGTEGSVTDHIRQLALVGIQGTHAQTGDAFINELVDTGGLIGMSSTIILVICSICFGASLLCSNMLRSMMNGFTHFIIKGMDRSTASSSARARFNLVSASTVTGVALNICTCDQYTAIILNGNIYQKTYEDLGFENKLLSRTIEDSTTVTSVLIPWSTCGVTQAAVLGIPTLVYAPYCIFNYVSPLMTLIVAAIGTRFYNLCYFNPSRLLKAPRLRR